MSRPISKLTQARTKATPDEMAAALEEAVACPLRIMQQAQEGLALMAQGGAGCALHLVADLLVACELLGAAFRGAHHIARANLPLMPQDSRRAVWDEALSHTLEAIEAEWQLVRAELLGKTGMALIIAADNLNILNPVVAQALDALDPQPLQELARRVEQAGADLIDINPGFLPPRRHDRMAFMVESVQQVTSLRLILDSPDARVLARGLAAADKPPILNACTLEEEKLREILPLAAAHGTDLVLLLLDARSFPAATLEGKITLALELREHALAAGLTDAQLIYDPVLPNLTWPDAWAQVGEVVKAVRLLHGGELWGEPARTMAGLSNLRSGLRHTYPVRVEEAVLGVLAGAGLQIALVDVLQPGLMETVRVIKQVG